MKTGGAIIVTVWMRRRQAYIGAMLALAMLFNAIQVLAGTLPADMAMTDHTHSMHSSCCSKHTQKHDTCFQGTGCSCPAHCSSFLSSQLPLMLHGLNHAKPLQLSQIAPTPHVFPPPQRPPRA